MEKSGDKMHVGMTRINDLPIEYVLTQTVQIVFGATIYWVWGPNPDAGRRLLQRMPLLAFDAQPLNAPLDANLLERLLEDERHAHH
jgi:hypothetical protein